MRGFHLTTAKAWEKIRETGALLLPSQLWGEEKTAKQFERWESSSDFLDIIQSTTRLDVLASLREELCRKGTEDKFVVLLIDSPDLKPREEIVPNFFYLPGTWGQGFLGSRNPIPVTEIIGVYNYPGILPSLTR